MYTLEALIPDCVGRYITSSTGSVQLASLINGRTYAKCWQALVHWVSSQFEQYNSINLAPLGIIMCESSSGGDGGNASGTKGAGKQYRFCFLRTFLEKHKLSVKDGMEVLDREEDVSAIRMNLQTISQLASVEPQTFRIAMSHLFRRLGEALCEKEQLMIDFSIGLLTGENGQVNFILRQQAQLEGQPLEAPTTTKGPANSKLSVETRNLRSKYPLNSPNATKSPKSNRLSKPGRKKDNAYSKLVASREEEPAPAASPSQRGLPNAPDGQFRRVMKGVSPLRKVRQGIESRKMLSPKEQSAPGDFGEGITMVDEEEEENGEEAPVSRHKVKFGETKYSNSAAEVRQGASEELEVQTKKARSNLSSSNGVGANLPPVLDAFARTQAATYSSEKFYSTTGAKIASFFTPEASQFNISMQTGELVPTGFVPFEADRLVLSELQKKERDRELRRRKPAEVQLEERAQTKSFLRYQYYIESGIDNSVITPIKEEWIRNSLSLLSTNQIDSVMEERVEHLIHEMLVEMNDDYRQSMKQSILNYILKNTKERARLSISIVPPSEVGDWGCGKIIPPPPAEWREPIRHAYRMLNKNLFCNNPAMVELLVIWHKNGYSDLLLVDLPQPQQPITVKAFENQQKKHLDKVRGQFMNQWRDEVEQVLKAYSTENGLTDANSVQFFESVATLMANQLRTIVQNSADALHGFFMQYKHSPSIMFKDDERVLCNVVNPVWIPDPPAGADESNKPKNNPRPVFLQKLNVHKMKDSTMKIGYEISLSDMSDAVARVFDNMVVGLNDFPRAESKIFSMLDDEGSRVLQLNVDNEAGESIWSLKTQLTNVFNRSIRECAMLSTLYDEYSYILEEDLRVEAWLSGSHSLADCREKINGYRRVSEKLAAETSNAIRCPMVMVEAKTVNSLLVDRANALANKILDWITKRNISRNQDIHDNFRTVNSNLTQRPSSTEELVALVEYLQNFQTKQRKDLIRDCATAKEEMEFLYELNHPVGADVLTAIGDSWVWLRQSDEIIAKSQALVADQRKEMEDKNEAERKRLSTNLQEELADVNKLKNCGDMKKISEYLNRIHNLKQALEKGEKEIEALHEQETLLGLPLTEFPMLQMAQEQLEPHEELWNLVSTFTKLHQGYMRGPVFKLDAAQVDKDVDEMFRASSKLSDLLAETAPEPANVASNIKRELAAFKPHVPLVHILCNTGMRDRHWAKLSDIVGFDVRPDKHTSLTRMLDMGINQYITELQEISEAATKEFSIEQAINTMQAEWNEIILGTIKHRDSGTTILSGDSIDEIQTLLDDHIIKVQTMKNSPFAKAFLNTIIEFDTWLVSCQEIVEIWLKVQGTWMYLEPVFGSEDIRKQMPAEGAMFTVVDGHWRKLMAQVDQDPKIESVTRIPNIITILIEARKHLDTISTGLNRYLETKRLYFPRFFFLSNDELLEILSETKDPLRVQPHLKKCFEGINKLVFKDNLDIEAMLSAEGEVVPMCRTMNPKDAKGAVERWLRDVEALMFDTLRKIAGEATAAYTTKPRIEWCADWPGQLVLNCSQIHWTSDVEKALPQGKEAVQRLISEMVNQLNLIVEVVRGKLIKSRRKTMGALVVMDVHARDVVTSLLEGEIFDVKDFDWTSQLRYYWEDEMIRVRMISSCFDYGNEYLGTSSRLVITKLTDRCYRTLTGALALNLGGAPEGPAGTGKTETTKDLAKAIAIQCVVFNCSDGLDYIAMGKFFKGLAASGSWACFDEFNRIDLEVLSVVAQQIQTIQRAKMQNLTMFTFEGTELELRVRCAVFITMNPGYAGRSELPDNLKVLFRTVAMMVPDYGLIAEILLYSFGFVEAKPLSRKITSTYTLCSEQLSSQSHYDYGMRAVGSVLTAASQLKQQYPDEKEDMLMLRAITDVNLPKFLSQDIPLFNGILSDLFPGVVLPTPEYEALLTAVDENLDKLGMQKNEYLISKIVQLYDMVRVRHGLMIVGLSFSGKSVAWRVLSAALTDCKARGQMGENAVQTVCLNPKSITSGELYGRVDAVSGEWKDGVLARNFAELAASTSPDRKWLIFDGPVDAIWIENMNTVLDDNKKLCLNSGQIIAMSDTMTMMFEVADLAVASPATVSRCGMVYLEPHEVGVQPMMKSYVQYKWREQFPEEWKDKFVALFDWLVPPCLRFIKGCQQYAPYTEANLVLSLNAIFDSQMADIFEAVKGDDASSATEMKTLEGIFLFALIWSIGNGCDLEGRGKFSQFLHEMTKEVSQYKLTTKLPPKGSVYDYIYQQGENRWVSWVDTLSTDFVIAPDATFHSILVPTADTARYSYLFTLFTKYNHPTLLIGPTGTGKSCYALDVILEKLDRNKYLSLILNFSAQTKAKQTQWIIDDKLDRRRRGVFGPKDGKKLVIFVDDLNMPQREEYGAQPPIELLRQYMDYGGWYDTEELAFRNLMDLQFCSAMGPPGGGRNPVSDRYLRHFRQLSVTPFDDVTVMSIFSTILNWHFALKEFPGEITKLTNGCVAATQELYKNICENMLPTPAKSHYTYNLRDFARVVQGLLLSSPKNIDGAPGFMRMWVHEVHRTFCDRLVNNQDQQQFLDWCREGTKTHFKVDFDTICAHLDLNDDKKVDTVAEIRNLIFGDFMNKRNPKPYEEVRDGDQMQQVWESYLEDYNTMTSKPMKLVMFRFAIEHAARIVRIIKQPRGNALLVGVGGSGKQSLTRLATSVQDYGLVQIELTKAYSKEDWKNDIKILLKKTGGEGKPTTFLFADTQVKFESMLEDINGLLNAGEVPNLWEVEEMQEILDMVRVPAKRAAKGKATIETPAQLYAFFTERVKENMHIVLAMSPIGDSFRERIRMFPSLVNCCTIDWFQSWPVDALQSVASDFLAEVDMDSKTRESCVDMCMTFHKNVEDNAELFLSEAGRYYYLTPTSYLELINTFKTLLAERRTDVMGLRDRYQTGLDKLYACEASVKVMQVELEEMQPVLIRTSEETVEMIKVVEKETEEADKIKVGVVKEEAVASKAAATAKAISDECTNDLAVAMPMLKAAVAALDTLTTADISEMKNFKSPPPVVKLVVEAMCIMKRVKSEKIKDPAGGNKKVDDYWGPGKVKVLGDSKLLKSLKEYDKDNIAPDIIKQVRKYIQLEDFQLSRIKQVSTAAFGFAQWIYAMESYDRVAKEVAPKKIALAKAQAEFAVVQEGLAKAQAELKKVMDKIDGLNRNLQAMKDKKKDLEYKSEQCTIKLERANKLIGGLGGEKDRWTAQSEMLSIKYENLTGDVLLASGVIAYVGAFTARYRSKCVDSWVTKCGEMLIPCSESFRLSDVVGNPIKIRGWVLDGLPNDQFSIDNAIIIDNSRRWPLMIDPQNQANKWIKTMEADNQIVVFKQTDNYGRKLEAAISFGKPCLLENVGESLDPALEPLLLKQIIKRGSTSYIKFGEGEIEYSEQFKFFMTTKLRNPHYLPEVAVKVTLLNFMITLEGLEDQLLGIVVAKEKPQLEIERNELVVASAANKKRLAEIEDQILQVLSSSKGNILDDSHAIEVLSASKAISNEIEEKQEIASKTEAEINITRAGYVPVASYSSVLFFCISELANIDPMYQYSLEWYINLFNKSIADSEFSSNLETRIRNLNDFTTYSLYKNVCRSLFGKDKLLFSLLLCVKIALSKGDVSGEHWRFFLTGGVGMDDGIVNPCSEWLLDKSYAQITRLAKLENFDGLTEGFSTAEKEWAAVYQSREPHTEPFPGKFNELNIFKKMCIVRCLRPDKVVPVVREYVAENLGQKFVDVPPFDLEGSYYDSQPQTPIIFILSPGADPMASLLKFSADLNIDQSKIQSISLGQGQGPIAQEMIQRGLKEGNWVVLQNCHLAVSWMTTLEKVVMEINPEEANKDFRLWLTSYPSKDFPISVLQNGVKITTEPPKGLKNNLLDSYLRDPIADVSYFENCPKVKELKNMTFALTFFHALIQERRAFGSLGWNIPYEFNESDLRISARQLKIFITDTPEGNDIPYKALSYLCGECNYGGRVTDDQDRRTIITILAQFFNPKIHTPNFALSVSGDYRVPAEGPTISYVEYIKGLPIECQPEVFGMHDNADITKNMKETNDMLDSILLTEGSSSGSGGGGASRDTLLTELATDILNKLPPRFNLEMIRDKYPVVYMESMNTVLCQECIRYNRLTDVIRDNLLKLRKAIVGLVVMSADLDAVANDMFINKIPAGWLSNSYPSLKPLGSYISDLAERLNFLKEWIANGPPTVTWFSGLFFSQSFLTGALQNYARKHKLPIDSISFEVVFMGDGEITQKSPKPADGVYTNGLFLEGARWEYSTMQLAESLPKILFSPAPMMWLKPNKTAEIVEYPSYRCPVYREGSRRGTLSTSGHSTNFVMNVKMPTDHDPSHWVLRGVAMITQLAD